LSIAIVLEGGPGVGKSSVARFLKGFLEGCGIRACIVGDGVRLFARYLARVFGRWFLAPREVIEYMVLGWQLGKLSECISEGCDAIIMDYGPEAPLGYMEADGVEYPRELDRVSEAALQGLRVLIVVLEPPASYGRDGVRWEDLWLANRYRRFLTWRALSLVPRLGAKAIAVPEKGSAVERAAIVARVVLDELGARCEELDPRAHLEASRGEGRC